MNLEIGKYYLDGESRKVYIDSRNADGNDTFYECYLGYYVGVSSKKVLYFTWQGERVIGRWWNGGWIFESLNDNLISVVGPSPEPGPEPDCRCDVKALISYGHERDCTYHIGGKL